MTKFNQTYPTDLKYTEWQQIMEFFPSSKRGRPPKWEKWQILNAIFLCQSHGLPVADVARLLSALPKLPRSILLLELAENRWVGTDQ